MHRRLNSLTARMLLTSGAPLVLFVGIAALATMMILHLLGDQSSEKHTLEVLHQVLLLRQHLVQARLAVRRFPFLDQESLPDSFERNRTAFHRVAGQLRHLFRDVPSQQERLAALVQAEEGWHQAAQRFVASLRPGPHQPRADLKQATRQFDEESAEPIARIEKQFEELLAEEERQLGIHRAETEEQAWFSVIVIGSTLGAAVLLSVLLSLLTAGIVSEPIQRLRDAAGQLVAGQFQLVPISGPTEIQDLILHFNHLAITVASRVDLLEPPADRSLFPHLGTHAHLLWTTNAEGLVVSDLPTWQSYTSQSPKAVRGLGWLDAVHPEDRAEVERLWQASVRDQRRYEVECRLRGASGAYRDFYCRAAPVLTSNGSVCEWVGTGTDVTERKREAALRRAKEEAENASRAKSEFLTKMSHELRTPLNAVIGMSRMLLTQRFGPLNGKQADYLRDITQAGEHLLALINDILDLSKVEAGKMEVHPEALSLNETVSSLLSTIGPLAAARNVALHFQPAPDGLLTTDPARFRQVLLNLLSNAIKFTPGPGQVTVACAWVDRVDVEAAVVPEAEAAAVRVTVRDTGIGIAAEDQARVWEEFCQIKTGATQSQEGTGLGLTLTRPLVRLLGGQIRLQSTTGMGSTFTVVLPRQVPTGSPPPDGVPAADRPLVLVIEDYPPTHKLLVDWLSIAGLATASAYDGEAGLELARRLKPQLIVLDIRLPKRDGWQVLTELKSDPQTVSLPVVIVTVNEERQLASALGVEEYFVKPVDRDQFLGRLREWQPQLFPPNERPALPPGAID